MVTLSLTGLSVDLGGAPVLRGVDAALTGGALVGIIGPNGAGKSTLVRAILGLIPLSSGAILLDGQPLARLSAGARAQAMAYLPQQESVHWPVTVERLAMLGRLPHLAPLSRPVEADRQAVEHALARTGMVPFRARTVTELSGGEQARAMLARALAVEADILIVDEPLAALDPAHRLEVMALLRAEAARGALVLAILHDMNMALGHCDRLLVLDKGMLAADGAPQQVLTEQRIADIYGVTMRQIMVDGQPHLISLRP